MNICEKRHLNLISVSTLGVPFQTVHHDTGHRHNWVNSKWQRATSRYISHLMSVPQNVHGDGCFCRYFTFTALRICDGHVHGIWAGVVVWATVHCIVMLMQTRALSIARVCVIDLYIVLSAGKLGVKCSAARHMASFSIVC